MSVSPEALCSMQSVSYFGLSQLFLYINRTDGRSTKSGCGFHKLMEKSNISPVTTKTHLCKCLFSSEQFRPHLEPFSGHNISRKLVHIETEMN